MNTPTVKSWAHIKLNNDFIFIETYSGYFNCLPDPEGKHFFLSPSCTNGELGRCVIEALTASRMIDPKEKPAFFDFRERVATHYDEWVANAMTRFAYKTKRALFKGMSTCLVDLVAGVITIRPSHHEKLEAWSGKGITEKDHVVITSDSTLDEVGVALRLAFSRCTQKEGLR